MSKKHRKPTLARANQGAMISPAQLQNILAQTFYGSAGNPNIAGRDATMFSPGNPLQPQPGVDKAGKPVQYQFPIAYNSFPIDRSQGKPDIPSFQQLRTVARLYSGITLCERNWFDMVPRMQLKVSLHPDYVAQGYEEKDYQKEISYFRKWFEKPDGRRDIHTWLRMALREQTQIDELYLYKHRTRGGKLLGLHIVAGDTMKPLLNDWGDIPLPDDPAGGWAYQQYPWGIPGMLYRMDQMVHYQESPAAESPYGQGRVERIIMEVNQALRKKKRDLAMFTEGNIPSGLMEVPDGLNWTPDQIDAYEQSWNALIAGNAQQQARMKFTMPGMKYIRLDNGEVLTDYDMFLLTIAAGCYGMSLQDLAFTGDIHKSASDAQQNVLYRRTIGPLALVYGWILTDCMHNDFDPGLHGEMFIASFGGFEEAEDFGAMATAYRTLTDGGILGLTNAAKSMKLPEDPDAPHIGRVFMSKDGPIFLDDMANEKVRAAALKAKMAGFELAANPPDPNAQNGEGSDDEKAGQTPTPIKGGVTQQKQTQKDDQSNVSDSKGSNQERAVNQGIGRANDTAQANDQQNTGIMVAFMLDQPTAEQLALPGGEPIEDLHCTLAYMGDMNDEAQPGKLKPAETLENIKVVLSAFSSAATPLQGNVGGIGRFTSSESSGGASPIIALVNAPGLQEWRRRLVQVLDQAGYYVANNFDYTPHITLSYVPDDEHMPIDVIDALPLNFDTLCLAMGDDRYYFPLGGSHEPRPQQTAEANPKFQGNDGGADRESTTRAAGAGIAQSRSAGPDSSAAKADYKRWRARALEDIKSGRTPRAFASEVIPEPIYRMISQGLSHCTTADQVRAVFARAQVQEAELVGGEPRLEFDAKKEIWEPADTEEQLAAMRSAGAHFLRWNTSVSNSGVCPTCAPNDGEVREVGHAFPSGHRLPQCHLGCQCNVDLLDQNKKVIR